MNIPVCGAKAKTDDQSVAILGRATVVEKPEEDHAPVRSALITGVA
jgi:hypothetical protein